MRPTAALEGWINTQGPTSKETTRAASAQLTPSPTPDRSSCACRCIQGITDTATLSQATVEAARLVAWGLHLRAVRSSPFVRALAQAAAVLLVVVGLAFGAQAAFLKVPSRAQLLAVDALKALARYHVMGSTEELSARPQHGLCFENRAFDRRTHSFVLGSFVLVGRRQRYYDLGHGVHFVGTPDSTYKAARKRFLLAGCPEFLAQRLGSLLLQWRAVRVADIRSDGVAAYRLHFGRPDLGVELFVERSSLRPLGLALGPGALAPRSDLEPSRPGNDAELIARVVPTAFQGRLRRG